MRVWVVLVVVVVLLIALPFVLLWIVDASDRDGPGA